MLEPLTPRTLGKLEIELTRDSRGVVLTLQGELDLASAPELKRHLAEIESAQPGRVLIDLGGVDFMDSTGLALIVHAHRSAESNGHEVSLRRGSNQVQRLFELTGVVDQFIFED